MWHNLLSFIIVWLEESELFRVSEKFSQGKPPGDGWLNEMEIWETMGIEGKFYGVLWRGSMKKGG